MCTNGYRGTGRYSSKFKNLGYRWVPGTEKISEIGYRWVLGTKKISEIGYRPEKIFGYRWVPARKCTVHFVELDELFPNWGLRLRIAYLKDKVSRKVQLRMKIHFYNTDDF